MPNERRVIRANPAGVTPYGRAAPSQTKSTRGQPAAIPPGKCGFRGCPNPRLAGVWKKGGSYMCDEHFERLLPVRAIWDGESPPALAMRNKVDTEAELRALKYEEKKEINAASSS